MDSDSSSDEEYTINEERIRSNLDPLLIISLLSHIAKWAIQNRIKLCALDKLLNILGNHGIKSPKTSRTLLQNNNNPRNISFISNTFVYEFDIIKMFSNILSKINYTGPSNILISLNIDGLPIFKSTSTSMWPVLVAIHGLQSYVFPICLTYGKKPDNLDFLKNTIQNLKNLLINGLNFNGRELTFSIKCIVCDAPAKAFVKGVKQFNSTYGCDKCTMKSVHIERTPCYLNTEFINRTNEEFREFSYDFVNFLNHQILQSPFTNLDIDMIKDFNIDYMHCVLLGVMKKLLKIYLNTDKAIVTSHKLNNYNKKRMNDRICLIQKYIPKQFGRKLRTFEELERFKATEFRQLLLYTGKIIFKNILNAEYYDHFISLNIAISILSSNLSKNKIYLDFANSLLVYFVEEGQRLFGPRFCVYNVHSLLHLRQDVDNLGDLNENSAFKFENYMQVYKNIFYI